MHSNFVFKINQCARTVCTRLITLYQLCFRPVLGNHCRFYPSCSEYAKEALSTFSFPKAIAVITKRLLRCHPFCKGGVDPIHRSSTSTN